MLAIVEELIILLIAYVFKRKSVKLRKKTNDVGPFAAFVFNRRMSQESQYQNNLNKTCFHRNLGFGFQRFLLFFSAITQTFPTASVLR